MQEFKPVPAIEKAVAIFEYLENKYEGATLSEISSALALAKSSTSGILATLKQHGMLAVQGNNSRFVLGPKFLSFAFSAEKSLDIVRTAYPFMAELRDQINETVKLSVRNKDWVVVVSKIEAQKEYHVTTKIGARFPLHAGAAGKVLLAYSPQKEIDRYLGSYLEKFTEQTIVSPEALKAELEAIRENGYAEDHGERFPDVHAVACPLFSHTQEVNAVISVPYLTMQNEEESKRVLLAHLFEYSKKISQSMGYYA